MPLSISYKTSLLLDLDETSFVALSAAEFSAHGATLDSIKLFKGIHTSHTLSKGIINSGFYFFVINPDKLKAMIESIYKQGDDIIIFTSGLWLRPVLSIISQLCGLSEDISRRFESSLFFNPQHDSQKLGFTEESVRTLLKGYRLHGLFRSMATLHSRHFVLLDNEQAHIDSCKLSGYIDSVKATVTQDDTDFYTKVLEKMKLAHQASLGLSPRSFTYSYPPEILKAFVDIMKKESGPQPVMVMSS